MRYVNLFVALLVAPLTFGQTITDNINPTCETAIPICSNLTQSVVYQSGQNIFYNCGAPSSYFYSYNTISGVTASINFSAGAGVTGTYILYGPLQGDVAEQCQSVSSNAAIYTSGALSTSNNLSVSGGASYILQIIPSSCGLITGTADRGIEITLSYDPDAMKCGEEIACDDCIPSFAPSTGDYMVSAWVKEDQADAYTSSYMNSALTISFTGDPTTYTLTPVGEIIDGWQRIEGKISIPAAATDISISLVANNVDAFFDDIRFFPFDGSMMSYVYDPESLRLMAELDERNYATLYEYDEEGKLVRVKKETERGIMTIQENRDNIKKQ